MRMQTKILVILGLFAAGVFSQVAVPTYAGTSPSGISPKGDGGDDLRTRLESARAELAAVQEEIQRTEEAIQELYAYLAFLEKEQQERPGPGVESEIEAVSRELAQLKSYLDDLNARADSLERYIAWLQQQLENDGPTVLNSR